jgi:hypothetical protein
MVCGDACGIIMTSDNKLQMIYNSGKTLDATWTSIAQDMFNASTRNDVEVVLQGVCNTIMHNP